MKTIAILGVAVIAFTATAAPLQLVSQRSRAVAASASAGGDSMAPIFGGNGRYVLIASSAGNLALTASNTPFQKPGITLDVFLRDRASNTTALANVNLAGTGGADQDALPVGVSSNGEFVLFESAADNLVDGDTNGAGDVFVRDVVNGTTILVSANLAVERPSKTGWEPGAQQASRHRCTVSLELAQHGPCDIGRTGRNRSGILHRQSRRVALVSERRTASPPETSI